MPDRGPEDGNGNVLRWQVKQNTEKLGRLEDWRGKVDEDRISVKAELKTLHSDNVQLGRQLTHELDGMAKAIVELKDDLRNNRRVMIGVLATIATSAIVFALTVMIATGKLA
jgi:hypothetical protein